MSGAVHDYRLAGVVYPNAGTYLSGSRLRGDFRAPGMAGGLYCGQTLFPATKTAQIGRTGLLDASLGGYLGRKHDGSPGPKTMWIGLQRMRDFVIAIEAREALTMKCV